MSSSFGSPHRLALCRLGDWIVAALTVDRASLGAQRVALICKLGLLVRGEAEQIAECAVDDCESPGRTHVARAGLLRLHRFPVVREEFAPRRLVVSRHVVAILVDV